MILVATGGNESVETDGRYNLFGRVTAIVLFQRIQTLQRREFLYFSWSTAVNHKTIWRIDTFKNGFDV